MVNIVHKFGGSSLSSAERYQAVANIVLANTELGDFVVSASGKTTATLVKLWQSYQQNDNQAVSDILLLIDNNQRALIEQLLVSQSKQHALAKLKDELASLTALIAQQQLHEAPLLAHGEVWSARLLAAYLNQLGLESKDVDARQLFTLHDGQLLHQKNQQSCSELINHNQINVVTIVPHYWLVIPLQSKFQFGLIHKVYLVQILAKLKMLLSITRYAVNKRIC